MAILRVTKAFGVLSTGDVYAEGRLVDSSDPHVKGREDHFETVEAHIVARGGVEQATAEPGARRTRTRAKKAPAKPAVEQATETGAELGDTEDD